MGQPITDDRKKAFLETLSSTGSVREAARAATPWARGPNLGYESFRDLCRRDPEFSAACQEAKSRALGRAEAACWSRAVDGWDVPIVRNSKNGPVVCGHERKYDSILLLRLLGRLDPAWVEKRQIDSTVRHEEIGGGCTIEARDVLLLEDPDERRELARLLLKVSEARGATQKLIEGPQSDV